MFVDPTIHDVAVKETIFADCIQINKNTHRNEDKYAKAVYI